ncbi:MAG: nucleotide exchange factor GrpE [Buchnera aphidicola (Floraphis meitanensis)]
MKREPLNKNDINDVNLDDCKSKANQNVNKEQVDVLNNTIINLKEELLAQKLLSKEKIKLYHNRVKKNLDDTYKFSLNNFISSLLPTIDNIEYALKLFNKNDKNLMPVFDELKIILKNFLKLLKQFGLEPIDDSNILFDPNIHQAITMKHSNDIKENYVISIMQKGYLLNGRLLRPAMVIVSKPNDKT